MSDAHFQLKYRHQSQNLYGECAVYIYIVYNNLPILIQIYSNGQTMPPLRTCSLKKYEKINFKPGKYFRDNGAGGLLLNFFLKSTEFAAYGEWLPTAYSFQCVVLGGSVGHPLMCRPMRQH